MIAVAVEPGDYGRLDRRLVAVGAVVDRVVDHPDRHVVLARPSVPSDAGPVALRLRDEGWIAVARPDGGAALAAWHRDTAPVVVGRRLAVVVAWSEHERPLTEVTIELGPGGFGNGHHPTTRLLLEWAVDTVGGGERVLDVGCGSGVLGLAALGLGAAQLVAVDIKPEAVAATEANAELNSVPHRVRASTKTPSMVGQTFDIVFANVAREGIAALAPELVAAAGSGLLAVSGVTRAQADLVSELLAPFSLVDQRTDGDWAALVFSGHRWGPRHA